MSLFSRTVYSIFLFALLASVGCNKATDCGYFGTADDLLLSYHSYECDGNGVRTGVARVEYLPSSDYSLAYHWEVDHYLSEKAFINIEGSGPMEGFLRVRNTADGCFIFKDVDMLFDMPHGSIGNKVWIDSGDELGSFDSNDMPASDITVDLLDGNKDLLDSQTTDSRGHYFFENLSEGEYYIKVHKPQGYFFCPPNLNSDPDLDSDVDSEGCSELINLTECETNLTIDAGLLQ